MVRIVLKSDDHEVAKQLAPEPQTQSFGFVTELTSTAHLQAQVSDFEQYQL